MLTLARMLARTADRSADKRRLPVSNHCIIPLLPRLQLGLMLMPLPRFFADLSGPYPHLHALAKNQNFGKVAPDFVMSWPKLSRGR